MTTNILRETAKEITTRLSEEGYSLILNTYFAYGKYGYYFNFDNGKQVYTGLGTKSECYSNLYRCYYDITNRADYYKA